MLASYALIALGGALGSVARYGSGLAVARWAGPDFPWGTLAVNVLGSFLIGIFATATAADGRVPLSSDMRNFLIVGICGGFTTFSSFSLQTLELLRSGKPGWALANIGLSVAICLAAVAAGYWTGEATRPTRVEEIAVTVPQRQVLAVIEEPASAPGLLEASARLTELGVAPSVLALVVKMPAPQDPMPTEEVETAEHRLRLRAREENWFAAVSQIIERWLVGVAARGIGAEWIDVEGNATRVIAAYGHRAETVVVAARGTSGAILREHLHAALFESGTGVLVVPPGAAGGFGTSVAIAWQEDGRAEKAVAAALPILRKAKAIHVLHAGPGAGSDAAQPLPAILGWNSLAAQLHHVPAHDGDTGHRLLDAAHAVGADLVVMGAFGHGEWRDNLLGGVTRTMLAEADLPLLMHH